MSSSDLKLKNEIIIAGRRIAEDTSPYIIAEMACAHQGDIRQATALIDAAVDAEADCIQLQIFNTDANMAPSADSYPLLQKLYFEPTHWHQIMTYARQYAIDVSIFVYDEPSLKLALDLKPDMLKLNSSELSNPPMLIGAAQSGLPFTLGTGASTLAEIKDAVELILKNGGEQIILMHGVQNFPTSVEAANLSKIRRLKDEFGGLVIYADHTDANDNLACIIDLLALGQGASLLEKHIILDRSKEGVDWQAALEPAEFTKYVSIMRNGATALGPYEFQPLSSDDIKYRRFQKKTLVAACSLPAGKMITEDDVKFLRVQSDVEGLAPIVFEKEIKGRRLNRDLQAFEQILLKDLSN